MRCLICFHMTESEDKDMCRECEVDYYEYLYEEDFAQHWSLEMRDYYDDDGILIDEG